MDWETGLTTIGIVAAILTIFWFGFKCSVSCFNKVDIGPLVMWFKMFSIITWGTLAALIVLHYFIGG